MVPGKPSKGGSLTGFLGGGGGGGFTGFLGGGGSGGGGGGGWPGGGWTGGGGWGGWGVPGSSQGPSAATPKPPPYVEIDYVDPEEVALGNADHDHSGSPVLATPFSNSCMTDPVQCWITGPVGEWLTELEITIRLWFERNKNEFILLALSLVGIAIVSTLLAIPGVTAGVGIAISAIVGGVFGVVGYHFTKNPKERTPTGYGTAFLTGLITGVGKLSIGGWIKNLLGGVRISMPGLPSGGPV